MKLDLTSEEVRILDNELFVVQRKLAYLNLRSVDEPPPSKEELRYKEIVNELRIKLGKLVNRDTIERFITE